jgi:hypothetical protein
METQTVCFSKTLASARKSTQFQYPEHHHQMLLRYLYTECSIKLIIFQGDYNVKM